MSRRLATYGITWVATAAVILIALAFVPRTGVHAPPVPALPTLLIGLGAWVAGALIATRYRRQWVGLAIGGPGILLIGLALAQLGAASRPA